MADEFARDLRVFAPQPRRIQFVLFDGGHVVDTVVYHFMDLPCQAAIQVYAIEEELRTSGDGFAGLVDCLQRLVALLCPKLSRDELELLTPRQLQEAVAASHEVTVPRAGAEGAASPSPSAPSTTPSPSASTGDPEMSRG
jgi:hypothetical protein